MLRGSGGTQGHLDVVVGYKQPKKVADRIDTRYFKLLRNRVDGITEDVNKQAFYVARRSDMEWETIDGTSEVDIEDVVWSAFQAAKVSAGAAPTFKEISISAGRRKQDVKDALDEMVDAGTFKTGKRKTSGREATTYDVA